VEPLSVRHPLSPEEVTLPPDHPWNRLPAIAAGVGAAGIVASALLGAANPRQLYFSWLVAFLFFLSLGVGSLFFVLVHFAMQGGWGTLLRRAAENAMATLPLFVGLFVPVLLGMHELYPWSHELPPGQDALIEWKRPYLNEPFFLLRTAMYFACWSAIALWYFGQSRRQDRTGELAISLRLRRWSGPAIVVVALTETFAAFDWIMSLEPHWYSTIFGVYFFSGSLVAVFSFLVLAAFALRRAGLMRGLITVEHFHDLGKLLFGFTCFWAYIAFSQFLLIWYGNLPEETVWYQPRLAGSWKAVSVLLAAGHFAVPFLFLMSRSFKRRSGLLALGAGWMLLMHLLDLHWLVMPALHEEGFRPALLDLTTLIAIGGVFVAAVGFLMRRHALVPVRDPRLPESLAIENA
jgi:hypothetical protein